VGGFCIRKNDKKL